jgi:hypothetical protein
MTYITFLTAIVLSGIAGYYSVIGLTSIFVGAFWPIICMGGTLEVAKLVTASWLYRNWKSAPLFLKLYLTCAVIILMTITSMGIFGFLSKAHIDSTLNLDDNKVELRILNEQEKNANEKLKYLLERSKNSLSNNKTGSSLDKQIDKQIQDQQKELKEITAKKVPLLREDNKLMADIGPVKYVSELIYGKEEYGIDRAVRLVIMIIMLVFDPLAVLLLIASNISTNKQKDVNTHIQSNVTTEIMNEEEKKPKIVKKKK